MKNLNIFEVIWKIWLFGGFTKNQYRGGRELPKKGDLDSFAGLKEGLARKRGGGGGGVEGEMHTMETIISSS